MFRKIYRLSLLMALFSSSFILPQRVDIEGTYQLIIRKMADGSRISAPDIMGTYDFIGF
jgi:hypothetical protein